MFVRQQGMLLLAKVEHLGGRYASIRSASRTPGRAALASPELQQQTPSTNKKVKPFSQVPGPKGLPIIGSLLEIFKDQSKGHMQLGESFQEFGPIFKMTIANMTMVYICDVEAIEKVHRLEGKYPRRINVTPWIKWREENNLAKGILIQDGPEWKRMRALLDKRMMRPRHVATYIDSFNEVVTDFVSHIKEIRDRGDGLTVPNLDNELFHWSLETIGTVLYETRFGSFEEGTRDPGIVAFIQAVHGIFRSTEKVIFFPPTLAKFLIPKWHKMHQQAWQTIFATGKRLIDDKMVEVRERLEKGEDVDGFLPALIKEAKLSQGELYANISELMLGAVDTTSNSMQWILHRLSEHPEAQHRLHEEAMEVTQGQTCTKEHLDKMVYLKAFIKEVLRMYPIAGVSTRVLNDDLQLCGYHIPKDTLVLSSTFWTGRDPEMFNEPESFRPERWLRGEGQSAAKHSFAWLPFGFGPRMCVGRRVAELEMYLLTTRLVQQFQILPPLDEEPVEIVSRGLLVPSKSVNVRFIDRV